MRFRIILATMAVLMAAPAPAHFQELLPDRDLIPAEGGKEVNLTLLFTHPMENGPAMPMGKPIKFGVMNRGGMEDLSAALVAAKMENGADYYTARYQVKRPGDHLFFLEPAPYWEPSEGTWIRHVTKVVVNAMGVEDAWEKPVGLPVEIEPLARPYGLWTGGLFRGIVRQNGKPVPFAAVEVEYVSHGAVAAPAPAFVTQTIRADAAGVFSFALTRAGWWGFAALLEGTPLPGPDGKPAPVEDGALIWVRATDWPK